MQQTNFKHVLGVSANRRDGFMERTLRRAAIGRKMPRVPERVSCLPTPVCAFVLPSSARQWRLAKALGNGKKNWAQRQKAVSELELGGFGAAGDHGIGSELVDEHDAQHHGRTPLHSKGMDTSMLKSVWSLSDLILLEVFRKTGSGTRHTTRKTPRQDPTPRVARVALRHAGGAAWRDDVACAPNSPEMVTVGH